MTVADKCGTRPNRLWMRKLAALSLSLLLAAALPACAGRPDGQSVGTAHSAPAQPSPSGKAPAPEHKPSEQVGEPVFPTYTTGRGDQVEGGFQVYPPEGWAGKVAAENYETDTTYALEFYHIASRDAGDGGHLVSIHAFPEETGDPEFPQERVLGTLTEDGGAGTAYVLYAVFPTDVQGSVDAMDEYQELSGQVDDLLASLEARPGFAFTPAVPLS